MEDEYIEEKIDSSSKQEDYHRLVILIGLKKSKENVNMKDLCEKLIGKPNLNMAYRVQVEHMLK